MGHMEVIKRWYADNSDTVWFTVKMLVVFAMFFVALLLDPTV